MFKMENLSTVLICLILAFVCGYAVFSYRKKITSGCCGGGSDVIRIAPKDANKSHYAQKAVVFVDGMTCQNCAIRVENAFHESLTCYAKADFKRGQVHLWINEVPSEETVRGIVEKRGYQFRAMQIT